MSELPDLSIDDFAAFYKAVHGYEPFPWQVRLERIVATGEPWPTWLALPTASGKTSVIDIAVFALAVQVGQPTRTRSAPRRIFFIVDRRIVVDQAAEHGRTLAKALAGADAGEVLAVADRLRSLGGGPSPLDVHQLRGGMYRDDAWVRSPLQPAVITSTVDQVGSRLLFRGYGLRGGSMWPVHAGLVANDALLVLDEAHCSNPFLQTLEAVARYRSQAEKPLELPFQYSVMSATPPANADSTFGLDEDDHQHDILHARLNTPKRTRLVLGPKTRSKKGEKEFVEIIANEAVALVRGKAGLFPELKTPELYRGREVRFEALVAEALDRHRLRGPRADARTPVILQTFGEETARTLAKMAIGVPVALLISRGEGWNPARVRSWKGIVQDLAPSKTVLLANPDFVRWAHAEGFTVTPYTFRSADTGAFPSVTAEMEHFLYTLGVGTVPGDDDIWVAGVPDGSNVGTIQPPIGPAINLADKSDGNYMFRFGDEDSDLGHRNFPGISGWGWLTHHPETLQHVPASDWLFTAELIPTPGTAALVSLIGLGGTARRRRR